MALPTTADEVWHQIEKWPFAVLSFVTPEGESRSAGVMYKVQGRALHVVTGPDTWKTKHIRANPNVSMTITVSRLPIRVRQAPPAVISFAGVATVMDMDEVDSDLARDLMRGVDGIAETCVIRIVPVGNFVTYGIGVFPMKMRHPDQALARVAV
ncbi:MAG: pyridoxamine 5'-phosphate oxidase family protein [Acidimicrobiia bacterium]|nr:pyridoxamine 5'-phosphate oxidase family protein [Acidimicrobiia bacterium]MDX2467073.1 pyridoxamine 5'-phosphate oxidase family protein [Acidimicrobiia bacterium]